MRSSIGPGIDWRDGVHLRTYYEGLRGQLESEFVSWRNHYEDLARFTLPRQQRFRWNETNRGDRMDNALVDNTATMALKTLASGLMSGICTPTRAWFDLETDDPKLNEVRAVKIYLEDVANRLRASLLRSNFYQTVHVVFRELGLYGTSAYQILEDAESDARCYPWPVGSFYLSGDDTGRVDLFMRHYQMTVRQIVAKFGRENCSTSVLSLYESNAGATREQWFPIVNVIHRGSYYGDGWASTPWVSVWYEQGPFGNPQQAKGNFGLLRRGKFDECPVIAPRWDVLGEDFYGMSPGMDALGDTMGLQLLSMTTTKAVDKMVDPPMIASPHLANQKLSILPGDVTYADTRDGSLGFRPVYQVQFNVEHAMRREQEHRNRINEAYYKNLFLMIAESDRRQVTAEEIRAKLEERMTVLGPVLERNNSEHLEPLIRRWLAILERRGKLPAPPEALRGKRIKVQFVSLLAQAQKMLGAANIDRFVAMVGQEGAVNQGAFDIVDLDQVIRTYGDTLNVPPELMRDQKDVDAIRADKQRQAQQAQQADNAQKMASAAANLSQANTQGPNALADLVHSSTGA